MKKAIYFVSVGIILLSFSAKPRESINRFDNNFNLLGSGQTTIYNYSSNHVTSIVVQNSIGGNHTYSNPSLPITVLTNGNVTIIVHFSSPGTPGTLKLYQLNSSGGWDFIESEDYEPPYLSPISYFSGGLPNYTVEYQLRIY